MVLRQPDVGEPCQDKGVTGVFITRCKPDISCLYTDIKPTKSMTTAKLLDVTFSTDLAWDAHYEDIDAIPPRGPAS